MFWGQNLKSGESFSFDSNKSLLGNNLNITNISLSEALDNTKYYVKITNNGQTYQLCSLDKNKDSIPSTLSFKVQKGMKLSVKGGNRGTVSITGYLEKFTIEEKENGEENKNEEIDTDKQVEKKKEKKEVVPVLHKDKKDKGEKKEKEEKSDDDDAMLSDKDDDDDDDDDNNDAKDGKEEDKDEEEEKEDDKKEEKDESKDEEKEKNNEKEKDNNKEKSDSDNDSDNIDHLLNKKRASPDNENKNNKENKQNKNNNIKGYDILHPFKIEPFKLPDKLI